MKNYFELKFLLIFAMFLGIDVHLLSCSSKMHDVGQEIEAQNEDEYHQSNEDAFIDYDERITGDMDDAEKDNVAEADSYDSNSASNDENESEISRLTDILTSESSPRGAFGQDRAQEQESPVEADNNEMAQDELTASTSGKYVVQIGDSLSIIADRIFGTKNKWQTLAELNGLKNPDQIFPGDLIMYPINDQSQKFTEVYPSAVQDRVIVKPGDTLSSIAKDVLGQSSYWKGLWRLNSDTIKNPNLIYAGQSLVYISPHKLTQILEQRRLQAIEIAH